MSIHPFDLLMELDTRYVRLDCAALHLARDVYPDCTLPPYLAFLDRLAEEVAGLRPGLSANLRYEAMRQVIIEEYKFRGNEDDYYDPENSYLNRVIDRRTGVPISLSVIWLEVARRLKWPVSGVGLPGHFVIRFDDDERFVLVDPFRAGRTLSVEDCREVLDHYYEGRVPFSPAFLRPVGVRFILSRILNNLRQIYTAHHDWPRLSTVLKRLAAAEPENARNIHELTALLYSQSDLREAQLVLEQFLKKQSNADDQFLITEKLTHLEALLASLN
jgi:regulator of sirC expression with transglutaminase-like and TPR domain